MSLGQSKKIAEAAGDCWHEPLVVRMGIVQLEDQGFCKKCKLHETFVGKGLPANPDLSLPENRHILVEYVEKICSTRELMARFSEHLRAACNVSAYDRVAEAEMVIAPNEKYITALCRVIEDSPKGREVRDE